MVFDPNIRPALWRSEEYMRNTIQLAASCANIIMPGFDDEKSAFGDSEPQDTISRYSGRDGTLVVLKNGAGDVMVGSGKDIAKFPTKNIVKPVDTTAAGDSFNGAFLAGFAAGRSLSDSIAEGQKCAATVITHNGALVPRNNRTPLHKTKKRFWQRGA